MLHIDNNLFPDIFWAFTSFLFYLHVILQWMLFLQKIKYYLYFASTPLFIFLVSEAEDMLPRRGSWDLLLHWENSGLTRACPHSAQCINTCLTLFQWNLSTCLTTFKNWTLWSKGWVNKQKSKLFLFVFHTAFHICKDNNNMSVGPEQQHKDEGNTWFSMNVLA